MRFAHDQGLRPCMVPLRGTIMRFAHACLCEAQERGRKKKPSYGKVKGYKIGEKKSPLLQKIQVVNKLIISSLFIIRVINEV